MEIGKWAIASGLFGYLARTVIYIWKERKEGKKEARSNYQEAIAIAAKNRDAAHDGLLLLRQTIQRIQASPRSGEFSTARQHFEKAADSIAEPNVKSAQEFYDSLYQYDKEMPVLYSRKILKKARHFLANNEGAYRSMNKQLEILGTTLDLQLGPHESK
jgi:hypothetical protein